jgi:hypothetical protein
MGTPFKMKPGSPFQRNFGIGSPLHEEDDYTYNVNDTTGEVTTENETGRGIIRPGRKGVTGGEKRIMTKKEIYDFNKKQTERREFLKSQE